MKKRRSDTLLMGSGDGPNDLSSHRRRMTPTGTQLLSDADPSAAYAAEPDPYSRSLDLDLDVDEEDVDVMATTTPEPTFPPAEAPIAAAAAAPLPPPERAPTSLRSESAWFSAPHDQNALMRSPSPLMSDLEERRRGWQPPKTSRGLAFGLVSILLIGVAVGGTVFFLGPDSKKAQRSPEPLSTTTITNADTPAAPTAPTATPATPPPTEPSEPTTKVITPDDLPTASLVAPPFQPNVAAPGNAAAPAPAKPAAAAPAAPTPVAKPGPRVDPKPAAHPISPARAAAAREDAAARERSKAKAARERINATPGATPPTSHNDRALPDLDRAAAATGMNPAQQEDTTFSTPSPAPPPSVVDGSTPPPPNNSNSSNVEPKKDEPTTAPPPPAPSEVLPEVQLKR